MRQLLLVCGLNREAAVLRGSGLRPVVGGGSRSGLDERLAALRPDTLCGVVSFGMAGALAPHLEAGDLVCPDRVGCEGGPERAVSPAIIEQWRARLAAELPPRVAGLLIGSDRPVLAAADKRRLAERSGAAALDMESHVAAAYAAAHGLPFAVLRVISDSVDHTLPEVAGQAMRPDGSVDVLRVLAGIGRDPGQIPGLIRTARDAGRAFRTLRRVGGLLGPNLGLQL
ncbi:phosphorylase [Enterovirga sp.]|uniref:phosphorylase family protein n=1 Tax=Enterovirga sp. TaxID=2026350 RepID=UPI0026380597|nr:phosphorylase [Enterovirga sp.]MDB5591453.1 hypothetical protein [Enterovirga sp.]